MAEADRENLKWIDADELTWIFHECDEGQDFGIWFGGSLCFYLFRGYASDFVQTAPLPP